MKTIKRFIVVFLEYLCATIDQFNRIDVIARYYGCQFAKLSLYLNDKWNLDVWETPHISNKELK